MLRRFMYRFSEWFASPSGVMQTFVVTMGIVVIERIWPNLDPNGFWLLYALTVYSGVTQPVLAFAASVSADEATAMQERIQALQESQYQLLKNQADTMRVLLAMAESMQAEIEGIAEDIEEIAEERR